MSREFETQTMLDAEIEELKAELKSTRTELHAVTMLKCCYDAAISNEIKRLRPIDRVAMWNLTIAQDLACARYFKETGNVSAEEYSLTQAEQHAWARDNPEEVKRRADAVRARLKSRKARTDGA